MVDPFASLLAEGFSYVAIDLSKGVHISAWNKNDRKTYLGKAASAADAVAQLLDHRRHSTDATTGSAGAVPSMFEDLLG